MTFANKVMKKIYFCVLLSVVVLSTGCFSNKNKFTSGELVGAYHKKIKASSLPYGMVYIPQGTFVMGPPDEDISFAQITPKRQVTIQPFYMDETEITNAEYRQYVNWVRDSIAITDYLQDEAFYIKPKGTKGADANASGKKYIDWKKVGDGTAVWGGGKKGKAGNAEKLSAMYYQGEDRVFDRNELDIRLLKFNYEYYDMYSASKYKYFDNEHKRSDFINRDTVFVYPDTAVWIRDFAYAQNEPFTQDYFSHPSYDDYPVVGVNWKQARAFCAWRSELARAGSLRKGLPINFRSAYRLPTAAEFEYAASGGRIGTKYPWGGPYIRNPKGCLLANFKPGRGNYIDDGGVITVNVKSYFPNDYGLYNMSGNVSEWTSTAYTSKSSVVVVNDMNPSFEYEAKKNDPAYMKRKLIKGGSWKDIGYFLQNAVNDVEYQDTAKAYIGFRCVSSYPGRDRRDK